MGMPLGSPGHSNIKPRLALWLEPGTKWQGLHNITQTRLNINLVNTNLMFKQLAIASRVGHVLTNSKLKSLCKHPTILAKCLRITCLPQGRSKYNCESRTYGFVILLLYLSSHLEQKVTEQSCHHCTTQ